MNIPAELKYTKDHEDNAEHRANTAWHMVLSPVQSAVSVQRDTALELGSIHTSCSKALNHDRSVT